MSTVKDPTAYVKERKPNEKFKERVKLLVLSAVYIGLAYGLLRLIVNVPSGNSNSDSNRFLGSSTYEFVVRLGMTIGIILCGIFVILFAVVGFFGGFNKNPMERIKKLTFYSYMSVILCVIAAQIFILTYASGGDRIIFEMFWYVHFTLYWVSKSMMFLTLIPMARLSTKKKID